MAPEPTLGDFYALPIKMPQLPSMGTQSATHYVYVRPQVSRLPTEDDERSLFLANVPVDSTEAAFRAVFAALVGPGRFESIEFEDERKQRIPGGGDSDDDDSDEDMAGLPAQAAQLATLQSRKRKREGANSDKESRIAKKKAAEKLAEDRARLPDTWPTHLRRSGSTAVALMADTNSVRLVLNAITKLAKKGSKSVPSWPASTSLGPSWLAAHNRLTFPDNSSIRLAVDSFFVLYNEREAEAAALAKRLRNEPDEDGFVTVTSGSGSRNPAARRDEAEAARAKQLAREEKKKEGMPNFYRFQRREQNKAEQASMMQKYLETRKRVMGTKEKQGKFKPEV